jgi:crossover junction endodeoxyribonuclease RuvC
MAGRILLGLDPGYADLGYGVISVERGKETMVAYGSIKTPKEMAHADRLLKVYEVLQELIAKYRPEAVAFEKLFFSKNVKTALMVAEARGVIQVAVRGAGLSLVEFSPAQVKIAVCGHGAAEKTQVQKMVKVLLGLTEIPKPDDAADALAIAIALAHHRI